MRIRMGTPGARLQPYASRRTHHTWTFPINGLRLRVLRPQIRNNATIVPTVQLQAAWRTRRMQAVVAMRAANVQIAAEASTNICPRTRRPQSRSPTLAGTKHACVLLFRVMDEAEPKSGRGEREEKVRVCDSRQRLRQPRYGGSTTLWPALGRFSSPKVKPGQSTGVLQPGNARIAVFGSPADACSGEMSQRNKNVLCKSGASVGSHG
jgi:hypothetical protein